MRKLAIIGLMTSGLMTVTGQAIATPPATPSYHINGGQLLDFCKDTISMMNGNKNYNVSKSSWCIGFIQGAVTAHRFYSTYYTLKDYMAKNPNAHQLPENELNQAVAEHQLYCVPPAVNLGQLIKDITTYLQNNPKYQQEQASVAIARALRDIYPCK